MLRSLVGSEMCIRDRYQRRVRGFQLGHMVSQQGDNFEDMVDVENFEDWEEEAEDITNEFALASSQGGGDPDDDFFDASIGVLEEIIMGEAFLGKQRDFLAMHCEVFDRELEEMKLEYTTIFSQYVTTLARACLPVERWL
eukprot:TRINITY_DN1109_c0_g1_i1.p2 TRINITY_DN1109_c0_g1~~TRINITY_DN1109_c0_g1_i1.p2  ORF type:complete len:140 (+),score=52.09 TRINITY_DN1109_c0_g1_i1:73-492(+)